jgi:acyl-CoA synthetase (AMP-forming)/AMP-acid ligase II
MRFLDKGLEDAGREAVADAIGSWTYSQLLERVEYVAARLAGQPRWERGSRVGLVLPRRKESAALLLGVIGAGGMAVPFSTRAAPREIAQGIADAGISLLVAPADFHDLLAGAVGELDDKPVAAQVVAADSLLEPAASARLADLDPS